MQGSLRSIVVAIVIFIDSSGGSVTEMAVVFANKAACPTGRGQGRLSVGPAWILGAR